VTAWFADAAGFVRHAVQGLRRVRDALPSLGDERFEGVIVVAGSVGRFRADHELGEPTGVGL
jgi:hypothetical protein